MLHFYGDNGMTIDVEWLCSNGFKIDFGDTGVSKIGENILIFSSQGDLNLFCGINVNGSLQNIVECPDIIHTCDMVFVFMCKNKSVKRFSVRPQPLLTKIGAAINDNGCILPFHLDTGS